MNGAAVMECVATTRAEQIRLLAAATDLPLVEAGRLDRVVDEIWSTKALRGLSDVAVYVTLGEVTAVVTVHDRELLSLALAKAGHASAPWVGQRAPAGHAYVAVTVGQHQATLCIALDGEPLATQLSEVN